MAEKHYGNVPARRGIHLGAGAWARTLLAADIVRQRMPALMQGLREWQQAKETCSPEEAADRANRAMAAAGEKGEVLQSYSLSIKKKAVCKHPPPLL